MNLIGHLYGSRVYLDVNCGERELVFSKKQTRKFKNKRWVKKYKKKYTYMKLIPGMYQIHDKIVAHPDVWAKLKKMKEKLHGRTGIDNNGPSHSCFRRSQEIIQWNDGSRKYGISAFGMGGRAFDAQSCA